jgi:alkylation response protein AidB-like acyl-CoA dehydrogenase
MIEMDFRLNKEQERLAAKVAEFAASEIAPGADERDRTAQFSRELWNRMGDEGLLGLLVPKEYGGQGEGFLTTAVVAENLARYGHDMGLCISLTMTMLLCHFQLLRHANEDQKKKYLPAIVDGEMMPAFAVSEREHGSHPRYLKTTAERDGSDYIINGRKMYITNGPVADVVVVIAITEKIGDRNGLSAFFVEKEIPGFSVGEIMGLPFCRSSPHSELVFENCRVPAENLLGEKNAAFRNMVRGVRENEDALGMATFVGLLGWQLELAAAYLAQQDSEVCEERLLLLTDLASAVQSARTIARKTAWLFDEGRTTAPEYGLCHAGFQNLGDFASETLKKLITQEELVAAGLERPVREMGIARIGRNVSKIRKLKLGKQLLDSPGTLT